MYSYINKSSHAIHQLSRISSSLVLYALCSSLSNLLDPAFATSSDFFKVWCTKHVGLELPRGMVISMCVCVCDEWLVPWDLERGRYSLRFFWDTQYVRCPVSEPFSCSRHFHWWKTLTGSAACCYRYRLVYLLWHITSLPSIIHIIS